MNKRYCSIKEISEYTGLAIKTLYEWSSLGRIPSIKIGRRVLFDLQDIDTFMGDLKRIPGEVDRKANKLIGEIHSVGL